jgi:predicted RNase H-like HicB family nuclease
MYKVYDLPVVITKGESGYYIAEVPIIPGCYSQGKTKEEALAHVTEAANLCLKCQKDEGWILPDYTIEHIKVGVPCQKSPESPARNASLPLSDSAIS